jgi:Tfp pilus assembly PilM family ATPase
VEHRLAALRGGGHTKRERHVAKEGKLTPNQRLLDLIRKPAGTGDAPGQSARTPAGLSLKTPRVRLFSFGKPVHVGVDISPTQLVCTKVRGQDIGFEVLGTSIVPVPQGVEPGSEDFVALLRRTLSSLCGSGPVPQIWAAAQSSRANLQFVTIPKVASRQVDNAVFWTAKKEMAFDEAGVVFDFERRSELAEKGVTKLGAMAYTAPRDAVNTLRRDFIKAGFPLAGLTLEPFGHQNLFRRRITPSGEGAVANLHVGQNWSRLEIFSNGSLMFMRVIKTSMSGMEQAVLESLDARQAGILAETLALAPEKPGSAASPHEDALPKTAEGLDLTPSGETVIDLDGAGVGEMKLVLELDLDPTPQQAPPKPVAAPPRPKVTMAQVREIFRAIIFECETMDTCHPGYGLLPEDVMEMLEPVASRLVRQVEMTLKHYRESLGFEAVTHVTVSGLLGASKLFVQYIGEQLGLPCTVLDPLGGRPLQGRTVSGPSTPSTVYTQALGLAFSDAAATPNLLFTYREKAAAHASRNLEQWTLVGVAVVLAVMAFIAFQAFSTRLSLSREYETLSKQLAAFTPDTDIAVLERKTAALKAKREAVRTFVAHNRGVGIFGEALALAPDGVKVGTLTAEVGPAARPDEAGQAAKAGVKPASRLVLEGMIIGDSRLFEALLVSYVVALEGSPLFEDVSVKKSEIETRDGGGTGLRFVIALSLSEK